MFMFSVKYEVYFDFMKTLAAHSMLYLRKYLNHKAPLTFCTKKWKKNNTLPGGGEVE